MKAGQDYDWYHHDWMCNSKARHALFLRCRAVAITITMNHNLMTHMRDDPRSSHLLMYCSALSLNHCKHKHTCSDSYDYHNFHQKNLIRATRGQTGITCKGFAENYRNLNKPPSSEWIFTLFVVNGLETLCSLLIRVKTAENVWNEYSCGCLAGSAACQASWCCEVKQRWI